MSTQQHSPRRDPWSAPEAQGISVRATLLALVTAFVGIVILGALLVAGLPKETRPAPGPAAGESAPQVSEVPTFSGANSLLIPAIPHSAATATYFVHREDLARL